MSFVVTPDQMRAAEQRAIQSGIEESTLMRAAAESIAAWIDEQFHDHGDVRRVLGLVGPGNNGGDTLVTLGLLAARGWTAQAIIVGRQTSGELPIEPQHFQQVEILTSLAMPNGNGPFVVLDGLYGVASIASLPGEAAEITEAIKDMRSSRELAVIAIDVPSGVDATTGEAAVEVLPADATMAIGGLKSGLLNEPAATLAGEIVFIDIGLTFEDDQSIAPLVSAASVAPSLPHRPATAGKHDFGGTLVIGGSPSYFGAPRLTAEAALLVGAGIVGAAVPRMLISTIAIQVPEVVFVPLSDSDGRRSVQSITEALTGEHARYTSAVLGPGLGEDEAATSLLDHLFGQASPTKRAAPIGFGALDSSSDDNETPEHSALAAVPLVIDADALNWLAKQEDTWSYLENLTAVLTPHPGELSRLTGKSTDEIKADRVGAAIDAARASGQVVVLKGGYTVVAAPDGRVRLTQRATPELATPGTGDVLAGTIGGLLAQGMSPFDAACAAVYIGAEAGRRARYAMSSRSVLARDLLANIGPSLDDLDGTIW